MAAVPDTGSAVSNIGSAVPNMEAKKKIIILKIWIVLGIAVIAGVISAFFVFPGILFSIKEAAAVTVIGGEDDGPTTIYIAAKYNWKVASLILLLMLTLDSVFFAVVKARELVTSKKIRARYKALAVFFINMAFSAALFPGVFIWSLPVTALMIACIILWMKITPY